jgi:hypothetical protein
MCTSEPRRLSLLALCIGALLPLSTAMACGPDFPYRLLDDRANALSQLPEGSFAFEIDRFAQPVGGLARASEATLTPYGPDNAPYLEAREAVERQQLGEERFALVQKLRGLRSARQVERAGANLPAELRLYTAGAVAFARQDYAGAANYFQRLLELPAAERPLRSTWAAYSLGRSLAAQVFDDTEQALKERTLSRRQQTLLEQARQAFRKVRELSIGGFSDPLELGIASLGEEARLALQGKDWDAAIRLYASQMKQGSVSGYGSLRALSHELLKRSDDDLKHLLDNPEVQHLLLAEAFSGGEASARLMALLKNAAVAPENADRLAALSYQNGDYAGASQYLRQAGGSGLAWWLRAKLALRDGDRGAALQAYAKAAKAFPTDEDWGWRRSEGWQYENLRPQCRVLGEMAILALERGDYLEAFDQLYRSGDQYWEDAASVAERVLTTDELKHYVDARVAALPPVMQDENAPRPLATALRELLGRRLMREGRYAEAVPYFSGDELQTMARDYVRARAQAEDAWTAIGRAEGYYRAARLARQEGMELLGYELEPDQAVYGGNYAMDAFKPPATDSLLSANEALRRNASAAKPDRRFHYRWIAADLANRAADLLPPRSQAFAAVLCKATGWLIDSDPAKAIGYYRRYVEQGAYLSWANVFGTSAACEEPDFDKARQHLWADRGQALLPYVVVLVVGLLALAVILVQRRRKRAALAIVAKTPEEARNE